jgi:hypothetical protein
MATKTIPAVIAGQVFSFTYKEEQEEWIKDFCGCTIKNDTLIEKGKKRKKKGNRNVSKTGKQI